MTPTAGAVIVDEVLRTVTGSSGEVSMSLVPGKYLGQMRLSDDRYFQFTVPDGAGPFLAEEFPGLVNMNCHARPVARARFRAAC